MRKVLFYRNFSGFAGGHLKVWDYYCHLRSSQNYMPSICFSKNSIWDQSNPWLELKDQTRADYDPSKADILFLAGLDWQMLENRDFSNHVPIVNLVQSVTHADPNDIKFQFLSRKAIRICVSHEIASRLEDTNRVNGPIYTLPLGLDITDFPLPRSRSARETQVLIAGFKNPRVAKEVSASIEKLGIPCELVVDFLPRDTFLSKVNKAKIVVPLPMVTGEGYFMLPLEAMALESIVVSPDVPGNRVSCVDNVNSFRPLYDPEQIVQAICKAYSMSDKDVESFRLAGLQTVAEHSIAREKDGFLEIMNNIKNIW